MIRFPRNRSVVMNRIFLALLLVSSQALAAEPPKVEADRLLDCLHVVHVLDPTHKPLQLAALNGDIAAIQGFLENPVEDSEVTTVGSLLRYAAVGGQPEIVKLLLKSGVNPLVHNVYRGAPRIADRTPREAILACDAIDPAAPPYAAIIALLQEEEAAVLPRSTRAEAALDEENFDAVVSIIAEGPILDSVQEQIVAMAVRRNDLELLRRVFDIIKGLRVPKDIRSEIYSRPVSDLSATEKFLHERALRSAGSSYLFWLRHAGPLPMPAQYLNTPQNTGDNLTMLMFASQYGQLEQVKALLEAGADPDIKNAEGKTALDLVCAMSTSEDCKEIRRLLQQKGSSSSGIAAIKDIPAAYLAAPILLVLVIIIFARRRYMRKQSSTRHLATRPASGTVRKEP